MGWLMRSVLCLGAVYRSQLQRYNQLRILRKVKLRTSCWLSIFVLESESKDIALTTVLVTGPAESESAAVPTPP